MRRWLAVVLPAIAAGVLAFSVGHDMGHRDLKPDNLLPRAEAGNGDQNVPSQAVDSGYATDTNFTAFRSAVAVADTLTTTNILSLPAFQVSGRTSAILSARFTDAAATVGVAFAYVWRHPNAISDTDVTARAFSWKTASFTINGSNGTFVWATQSNASVVSNQIKGWSTTYTITAGSQLTEGSYYRPAAGDYNIDTGRAVTMRLLVTTAPSAGSVTFRLGS